MKEKRIQTKRDSRAVRPGPAAQRFSTIVETHRPRIFRFLLASTRDADLAETLTQDCFLRAYRNWLSFRDESSVMTWLMRIAINLQDAVLATDAH